jgi:signal transduction histidine kinase
MPLGVAMSTLDHLLYRLRIPFAVVAVLFILYCVIYLWGYIPYEDFSYVWQPDGHLVVEDVPIDSLAAPHLQAGDEVLEIGGQPILALRPVYPLPKQLAYEYKVLREGEILTLTIPFSPQATPLAIELRLPATILSFTGWVAGTIILFLAKKDNWQALRTGSIFLFAAMTAIGIQAAMNGVPGTWIVGYSLVFFLGPAWAYLGFLPRAGPLNHRARTSFNISFILAGVLALLSVYEALALYPKATSVEEQAGFSIFALGFLLAGTGLLVSVVVLAVRTFNLQRSSYLRQQLLILLVFIGMGTLPVVLLSIIPLTIFDADLLPFPIAISLMLLIPAGYLFVIYRRGFLGLDLFFSRSLHVVLFSLIVFGFYTFVLSLGQRLLNQDNAEIIQPATLIFLPTLLLAMYVNKPVRDMIERLVYGDVVDSQKALADYTLILSSRPEISTLNSIVVSLAKTLSSTHVALALKSESGRLVPVSVVGADRLPETIQDELQKLEKPVLRSAESDRLEAQWAFDKCTWAEILVPVKVRDEQIGVLALSRPGPDGYFNSRQVSFLTQAAGVLAVGAENIYLFESTRRQSRQRFLVQEEDRKNLSRQLHDDPLQQVTYAIYVIDELLTKHFSANGKNRGADPSMLLDGEAVSKLVMMADHLRKAAKSLRSVCIGLYPPFHDQGIELAVQDVIYHFENEHGLNIRYMSTLNGVKHSISEHVTSVVSRVLTEALNNVVKHARDAEVRVTIQAIDDEKLALSVMDKGPGTRVSDLSFSELIRRQHLGIVGMYEWAQEINGELKILPIEPKGTEVLLQWPL